jgi:hypothetical protein
MAAEGGDAGRGGDGARGRSMSPEKDKKKREKWRRSRSRDKCATAQSFHLLLRKAFICTQSISVLVAW